MQKITYGIHDTALGQIVIGQAEQGLCWLGFMTSVEQGAYKGDGLIRMKAYFDGAEFIEEEGATLGTLDRIFEAWEGDHLRSVRTHIKGTVFQKEVWNALLSIPRGKVVSYGDVANDIGRPKAFRAVGTAVGENPISLIIPCHRVVQKSGALGNYGWGIDLKKRLLEIEAAV
ncbi:MAG: methylated-DNA--[protein]-cysteine S-methyltransferase [Alphaproteobacteria bacterium]|nr:methylated-DNA--[protein]-cysteine S-methyltransferase [Alphaproteobacteria bacterium]NCQ88341.1 methylated-DNA--[protein]-cysteine S-methyltransferase [Alphaproteobacteria bacterium]NCT05165.1 methylated-DNA--[protein]-cysteine S-methyltransferase [Alphaproteobacteria bacterium]